MSPGRVRDAKAAFAALEPATVRDGDAFFEQYGVGNSVNFSERPYERFRDYELLLAILREADEGKYQRIHKGVPFYFLAWLAFDTEQWERGAYYLDAAIGEDILANPTGWADAPAARFLLLHIRPGEAHLRTADLLKRSVAASLEEFERRTSTPFALEDFRAKAEAFLRDPRDHVLLTSLYTFMMSTRTLEVPMSLRGTSPASPEPFLGALFKGGLVFESFLRHRYQPSPRDNLGSIFRMPQFAADFPQLAPATTATSLQAVCADADASDTLASFTATARIRNTTGHNLVWDDVFGDVEKFRLLRDCILTATLSVLAL